MAVSLLVKNAHPDMMRYRDEHWLPRAVLKITDVKSFGFSKRW
ncbi:hypothetical protein [Sporolactobacillus mangiferae]|nr:hypothetical protein [Sporolactobacillus mangiferae]